MPKHKPLGVVEVPLSEIVPFANNPREHPAEQIEDIARSIEKYGFNAPLLLNKRKEIVAGHGRFLASSVAGLSVIPCIILEHLTEAQERAYRIADNVLQSKSAWSIDLLATEVAFILEADVGLSVEDFGFKVPELDLILGGSEKKKGRAEKAEAIEEPDRSAQPISRIGDLWTGAVIV